MAAADLQTRVLAALDTVQDPCSLAQAIPIGIAEMGMVTDVRVGGADEVGLRDVELVLRVTAPGCMYVPFMDRSIRVAVGELEEVRDVSTVWEPTADWTPDAISPPARARIAEARRRRLSGAGPRR
jgi:metal-sulfur cluster biosynthetic enzyme